MWWNYILPAIGINAAKNIVTGQNPLKGAEMAALTSSVTGGLTDNVIPGATIPQASVIPGSLESAKDLVFNPSTGTYLNPEYFVGESLGMPIFSGGQGLLSNVGDELKTSLSNIKPENLTGLATLLSQEQQPDTSGYRQMAGTGGGVSKGQLGQSQPLSNVAVNRRKMNIWA